MACWDDSSTQTCNFFIHILHFVNPYLIQVVNFWVVNIESEVLLENTTAGCCWTHCGWLENCGLKATKHLFLRDQINFVLTSRSIIPPIVPVVAGHKWQTQSSGPESSGVPWFGPSLVLVTASQPLFLSVSCSLYLADTGAQPALQWPSTLCCYEMCYVTVRRPHSGKNSFQVGFFFLMWTHMSMCVYVPGCSWLNKLMQLLSFGPRCLRVSVEPGTSCPFIFF